MGAETQDRDHAARFAGAIRAAIYRQWPHHTAKHLAQVLDCTPKAAANLLDGHLSLTTMGKLIAAFGPGWVADRVMEAANTTLEACIKSNAERARQEQAAAEERRVAHEKLLEELRAARSGAPGVVGAAP